MDINENIKTLCKIRGLSFADLADRLKVTRQTLYRQSTGAVQLSTVERIANALQVPPFILLHPSPAAALLQIRTGQAPGPEDTTSQGDATQITCPFCGGRLQIQIRPEERREKAHDPKSETGRHTRTDETPGPNKAGRVKTDKDKTPEKL